MPTARAAVLALLAAVLPAAVGLSGCARGPAGPALKPDMADVIGVYRNLRPRPFEGLTGSEARQQPLMDDAVRGLWNAKGLPAPMEQVAQITDLSLQTEAALLPARLYGPAKGERPDPVILYFHGGGWVAGGLDSYDASARALAARTGAIVLSVHYRQAPENRFPAAHDDAAAALRWISASARDLGGDPGRIAIAGEGAGASLALAAAEAARDAGLVRPLHLLLIYPLMGAPASSGGGGSGSAEPYTGTAGAWFLRQYAGAAAGDLADPRLDPLRADLSRLPPTTVILAGADPQRPGGEALAARLQASGTPTEARIYPGLTHDFFVTGSAVADAKAAQDYAGQRLSQAFASAPAAARPLAPGERPVPPRRSRARAASPRPALPPK